jgi:hypothetical protein
MGNDQAKTAGGLKATMDRLFPRGWEIKAGGPNIFVVTTEEAADPFAVELIEGHFWPSAKVRYQVGSLS